MATAQTTVAENGTVQRIFIPRSIKSLEGAPINHGLKLGLMKASAYFNPGLVGFWGGPNLHLLCVVVLGVYSTDRDFLKKVSIEDGDRVKIPKDHSHQCGWFFNTAEGEFSGFHWFPVRRVQSLSSYGKSMFQNLHRQSPDLLIEIPNREVMIKHGHLFF